MQNQVTSPGDDRWLETERSEGSVREARRPARARTVLMPERAEEPAAQESEHS